MLLAPAILEVGCLAILTGPIKVFCEKFNIILIGKNTTIGLLSWAHVNAFANASSG